jgi:hypothetical protein
MANLRELDVSFLDWEARAVLVALNKERTRLKVLVETTDDEDEAADAGNDLLELSGLLERLESQAKSVFGEQIVNFNSQSI